MKIINNFFNYFFIGFSYLASKKVIVLLILGLFIQLLNTTYAYQEEILNYQEEIYSYEVENIKNKSREEIKVYNNNNETIDKTTALKEKISCYKKNISSDELPQNILEKIKKLNELYKSDINHFAFVYKDIQTGFTISYNESSPIFTASTIKAPAVIYLYEKVSKKEIDLEEKLTYTSNFYNGGSGILQNKEPNTKYTVKELLEYTIHHSDNIAYAMLMNRYNREDMYNFWNKLGTEHIFKYNTIWGYTSAKDATIYMEELYRFYLDNKEYGSVLMDLFKNSGWKMIATKDGKYNTASKGGWSEESFHDAAIVFEKNPYILTIMSKTGESNYNYLFTTTNKLVGELHEEYWQHKESICEKIKQY